LVTSKISVADPIRPFLILRPQLFLFPVMRQQRQELAQLLSPLRCVDACVVRMTG
jgi:hypothetical protein